MRRSTNGTSATSRASGADETGRHFPPPQAHRTTTAVRLATLTAVVVLTIPMAVSTPAEHLG